MRTLCVSDHDCFYRHNDGYCGYVGNGCAFNDTATVKAPANAKYRITQLVDISPESIEEIADAVAEKLRKEEVKHGHWEEEQIVDDSTIIEIWQSARCSKCGRYHTTPYAYYFDKFNYCPQCGAKMDEVTK